MAPSPRTAPSDVGSAPSPALEDRTRREWVSFEHGGDTYVFDATFLASAWTCIFGAGCRGVHEQDTTELNHGCCSHGAHFADAADRKRVRARAAALDDEQWQLRRTVGGVKGAFERTDDGWVTRVHEGACVFLNRDELGRGTGCALHVGALDAEESYVGWKPEVCWQLPLRLTHHTDELEHTTFTLREWKRRDWGEGGEDFHWWCTDAPDAFVGGTRVVDSMREEIVAMVGAEVYGRLLDQMDERPAVTWVPHPAVRP